MKREEEKTNTLRLQKGGSLIVGIGKGWGYPRGNRVITRLGPGPGRHQLNPVTRPKPDLGIYVP